GISMVLSPLWPIGYARELEPNPGFTVDPLAVGLGGPAVLLALLLAGSLAAWRVARSSAAEPREGTGRVRAADAPGRWGLPVPFVAGVRLALARGRTSTGVPLSSALVGSIVAVAAVAAALTVSASLHHLFSTPWLFGQNWDYRTDFPYPDLNKIQYN